MIADMIRQTRRRVFKTEKLRVLMYHSVSGKGERDALTVDTIQLEAHFRYLRTHGYSTILLSDLIAYHEGIKLPPENPVLVTFDDGYKNNFELAYPLAEKYGVKVNFFVVPAFIRQGEYRGIACMKGEDIRWMDPSLAEIGLHSFDHQSYADMPPTKMEKDIWNCLLAMKELNIPYQPCLAYPYGAYPRRQGYDQDRLFEILEQKGVRLAFRIGNRINRWPLNNKFLIQRMDITGLDSLQSFQWSLTYGKKLTSWVTPLFG